MRINADQNSGIDPNVDQFRSMPINVDQFWFSDIYWSELRINCRILINIDRQLELILGVLKISPKHSQETFLGPWPAQILESRLSIENHNGKSGLQSPSWPGSQKFLLGLTYLSIFISVFSYVMGCWPRMFVPPSLAWDPCWWIRAAATTVSPPLGLQV